MVDMLGNDTGKAAGQLMEFTYPAPADPTSISPEGYTVLRAEECFPYALHGLGGPRAWDWAVAGIRWWPRATGSRASW